MTATGWSCIYGAPWRSRELHVVRTSDSDRMLNMARFSFPFLNRYLLLWVLFFVICFGLGFSILSRYEPRTVPGLSDTEVYYETVTGESPTVGRAYMRSRILVPYVAKPFYWFALRYLNNWHAVFLACW